MNTSSTITPSAGVQKDNRKLVSPDSNQKFFSLEGMFYNEQDKKPTIIAGPCSIENELYLEQVAKLLEQKGVKFLRGGAYKPRTSPYDFQGLKENGLKILNSVCKKYNLYSVTEIVDPRHIATVSEYADVLQVGARNMYNYELLKELGKSDHPIILKRGLSATIEEWLNSAEYIALQGNRKIILCERGIRTYETRTRNTLDISCIPIIKKECSLPIIADLSHSLGRKDIVCSMAKAVIAAGADGIMVEVHPKPELALSDSNQQLNLEEFKSLLNSIQY